MAHLERFFKAGVTGWYGKPLQELREIMSGLAVPTA
jgi:hypothetical protein